MSNSEDELKAIQEELKWIAINDKNQPSGPSSKGIFGFLVPIGCAVTTGVLGFGVFNMLKRNSKKQQYLMRYRILAQGITLAMALVGILHFKLST